MEIDPPPNYQNINILWYEKKTNFGYAYFCFNSCFPWIKEAAKPQSYINPCKKIMYSHLLPPGLSPLGDQ